MAKIHIVTQFQENYGAYYWEGRGNCPQDWKLKGSEDYIFPLPAGYPLDRVTSLVVDKLMPRVEWSNNYTRSTVLKWQVVADDFRTDWERQQLEYDGRNDFPATTLTLELALAQ